MYIIIILAGWAIRDRWARVEIAMRIHSDRFLQFVDPHNDRGESGNPSLRWSAPFKATSPLSYERTPLSELSRSRARGTWRSFARETLGTDSSPCPRVPVTSRRGTPTREGRPQAEWWRASTTTWRSPPRWCTASSPRPRPSWRSRATDACAPRDACCWSFRWDPASLTRTPPAKQTFRSVCIRGRFNVQAVWFSFNECPTFNISYRNTNCDNSDEKSTRLETISPEMRQHFYVPFLD